MSGMAPWKYSWRVENCDGKREVSVRCQAPEMVEIEVSKSVPGKVLYCTLQTREGHRVTQGGGFRQR